MVSVGTRRLLSAVSWMGIAVAAVLIVLACTVQDVRFRLLYDNLHWTVANGAAALLAWRGVWDAQGRDAERSRRWFAWALTSYFAAQLVWDLQELSGWNPFPAPSDGLYILLGPLCAGGFLAALARRCGREQMRSALLDAVGLTTAGLAVVLVLFLPRQGGATPWQLAVLVAYPTALGFALSLTLIMTLKLQLALQRGRLLFSAGLLGLDWAWLRWNLDALSGYQAAGGVFNASFSLFTIVLGLGALQWEMRRSPSLRWQAFCDSALRLLPLLIVSLSATAIVLTHALPGFSPLERWAALLAGLFVVSLAALRQHLLLTERDRLLELERSLRVSEEAFRTVVEQAVDGIFVATIDGVTRDVSDRGAAIFGYAREELIGRPLYNVLPPDQVEQVAEDMRRLALGEEISVERSIQRKDGTRVLVEVRAKQMSDGRMLATMRDVSESRTMEEQLRQRQKMEAVGTLAAGIAHDFNNLLMTIRGYADMASEDLPPRHAARASVDEIRKASARATQLVRQILTFSRPATPSIEPVRLQDVVDEAVSMLRATLPASVRILAQSQFGTPLVLADATQMHQIVVNLCTNAWHALEGRSGMIEISVALAEGGARPMPGLASGRYVCLRISDTGRGMDAETRQRIFEPFFTTKRASGGTGLGLSVVHGIVRNHGGGITVESLPGVGTTFCIYLRATEPGMLPGVGDNMPAGSDVIEGPVPGGMRVLFVDDEQPLVTLAVQELQRRGHRVHGSVSTAEALATIGDANQVFDLVVSDQNMPRMSGVELLREIKARRPQLHSILITGVVDEAVLGAAAALGVDRVVEKPVTIDELCAVIQEVVAP
jgi:PAS domain S-box-containing protein